MNGFNRDAQMRRPYDKQVIVEFDNKTLLDYETDLTGPVPTPTGVPISAQIATASELSISRRVRAIR